MPLASLARVQPLISVPATGNESRLISGILMSAVVCDATSEFEATAEAIRQCLQAPHCRISIVDVERARHLKLPERQILKSCAWASFSLDVATAGTPLEAGHDNAEGQDATARSSEDGVLSRFGVPLLTSTGFCVGTLSIGSPEQRSWDDEIKSRLALFSSIVVRELELRSLALSDAATGLASKRALEQFAKGCEATKAYPSLLLIGAQINNFEDHCEALGREAAGRMLSGVGELFKAALRTSDLVARASDDRVIAACGMRSPDDAALCVSRILKSLSAMERVENRLVTLSIGIAEVLGPEIESALQELDAALYAARRLGPNRTVAARKLRQALQSLKDGSGHAPIHLLNTI